MKKTIFLLFLVLMIPSAYALSFSDATGVILSYDQYLNPSITIGSLEILTNESVIPEIDPQVNILQNGKYCYSDGNVINCNATTSSVETDPVYTAKAAELIFNASNGQTAFTWGNHALAGYAYQSSLSDFWNISAVTIAELTLNASHGETAFGWGNHALAGYLTGYIESDPIFSASYPEIYQNISSNTAKISYNDSTVVNNLQTENYQQNLSIELRTPAGSCLTGYAVQNTTSSGVQCVPLVPPSQRFNASTIGTTTGTVSGDITKIQIYDSKTYNVTEAAGGFITEINFTGITSFDNIIMREKYEGGSGHEVLVQLWDYGSSTWEEYYEITDQGSFVISQIPVIDPSSHVSGGLVQARFFHNAPGIASHHLYIDYFVLNKGTSTLTNTEHDSLSGRESIATNHPDQNINNTNQQTQINSKINGTGTVNTIPLFTENKEIGNSMLTQDASGIYVDGGFSSNGISLYANGSGFFYDDILIGGDILSVSTTLLNGTIIPSTTNTYNLGSYQKYWNTAYINELQSNQITLGATNGDRYIYFYHDDPIPNGYIKWESDTKEFYLSNRIYSTDFCQGIGDCMSDIVSYNDSTVVNNLQSQVNNIISYNDSTIVNNLQITVAGIVSYNDSTIVNNLQISMEEATTNITGKQNLFTSNPMTLISNASAYNLVKDELYINASSYLISRDEIYQNISGKQAIFTSNPQTLISNASAYPIARSELYANSTAYLVSRDEIYQNISSKSPSASPTFTGTVTTGVINNTLTHGTGTNLVTMIDFGNVSMRTNSTHFCIIGKSTVCVET